MIFASSVLRDGIQCVFDDDRKIVQDRHSNRTVTLIVTTSKVRFMLFRRFEVFL